MEKLSFSMENYLEAVYELSSKEGGVRLSDVAIRLGVTKASTNNAMSILSEKGLVINEKYKAIYLTPLGRKMAEATSKKHRIIRHFLTKVLDIDPDIADADACAIEHVISNHSIRSMQLFLQKSREPVTTRSRSERV